MKLTKKDFHWFYAFPIYLLIIGLWHQMARMLMVWGTGGKILHCSMLPTFSPSGWLRLSTVDWGGGIDWFILAAPYLADLVVFMIFLGILLKVAVKRRWLFINLLILGIVSPFVNSAFGYFSTIFVETDVNRIITFMPYTELIHIYFVLTLCFYVLGFQYILGNSATARYFAAKAHVERRRIRHEKKQKKKLESSAVKNASAKNTNIKS